MPKLTPREVARCERFALTANFDSRSYVGKSKKAIPRKILKTVRFAGSGQLYGDLDVDANDVSCLPDDISIGDRVFFSLSSVLGKQLEHSERALLISGVRRREGRVIAVEGFDTSTKITDPHFEDLVITDMETLSCGRHKAMPMKIITSKIFTIANDHNYFGQKPLFLNSLPDDIWPDVMVRHAEALLFNSHLQYTCVAPHAYGPDVTREGFQLKIPAESLRLQVWTPHLETDAFEHQPSGIMSEKELQRCVDYANSFRQMHSPQGSFPPYVEQAPLPTVELINWREIERLLPEEKRVMHIVIPLHGRLVKERRRQESLVPVHE